MIRKLLCGAIAIVVLGHASMALANDIIHRSKLVHFPGFRTIKLETSFLDHAGIVSTSSNTICADVMGFYVGKESLPQGTLHIDWFIEAADGTFESIDSYNVTFTGKEEGRAIHADPMGVKIEMASYVDYPECAPTIPFTIETAEKTAQ